MMSTWHTERNPTTALPGVNASPKLSTSYGLEPYL